MSYINAQNVLPKQVLKIIQQYIDGECLYIPRKDENHKSWGEKSGTKEYLIKRNKEIFNKYISGTTIVELAQSYFLSEKSIRRIIGKEKIKKI